jgi:hypothetical protein
VRDHFEDDDLLTKPTAKWTTGEKLLAAGIAFLLLRGLLKADDPQQRQQVREVLRDPKRQRAANSRWN